MLMIPYNQFDTENTTKFMSISIQFSSYSISICSDAYENKKLSHNTVVNEHQSTISKYSKHADAKHTPKQSKTKHSKMNGKGAHRHNQNHDQNQDHFFLSFKAHKERLKRTRVIRVTTCASNVVNPYLNVSGDL